MEDGEKEMKCYICEGNLGEEAGWDVCPDCKKAYPLTSEALLTGELVAMVSGAGLLFKLVKKK